MKKQRLHQTAHQLVELHEEEEVRQHDEANVAVKVGVADAKKVVGEGEKISSTRSRTPKLSRRRS